MLLNFNLVLMTCTQSFSLKKLVFIVEYLVHDFGTALKFTSLSIFFNLLSKIIFLKIWPWAGPLFSKTQPTMIEHGQP